MSDIFDNSNENKKYDGIEYSRASEQYLRPVDREDLGDAILHITCTPKGDHFIAEIYEENHYEGINPNTNKKEKMVRLVSPYSLEACRFIEKRFQHGWKKVERKGIYHPIYQVPITDYSVLLITKAWTGKKIISDMAKPFFTRIFMREFAAEQNAKRVAAFEQSDPNNPKVPEDDWTKKHDAFLYEHGMKYIGEPIILAPYQKVAAYNSCKVSSYGLFKDPGLGKTVTMIRKLDYLIDHSPMIETINEDGIKTTYQKPTLTLVLCPKSVRTNWEDELDKFSMCRNKMFIILLDGASATLRTFHVINQMTSPAAFNEDGSQKHIVIISGYEAFVKTEKFHKMEYDLCLLDESDNIANFSIKRTKKLLEVRNIFKNKIIATGTAIRNSLFDLYPQFEFLGEGFSGFDTHAGFKAFHGQYAINYSTGHAQLTDYDNVPLLKEKIAKHCFVGKREKLLPFLPKKTQKIVECTMSHEQLAVYKQMAEQMIAMLESYGPDPNAMTVNNVLTQMLRLEQITSGYATADDGTITRFDPNPKLELLTEMLIGTERYCSQTGKIHDEDDDSEEYYEGIVHPNTQKIAKRKFIVWTCFKENIKQIKARLALAGLNTVIYHGELKDSEKDFAKHAFNKDKTVHGIVGIAASGGVGLNLVGFDSTRANEYETNCDSVFYYASNWSSRNRVQSMDRAYRMNTRVPIQVYDLIVPRSIDKEIYDRVIGKIKFSDSMQEVRSILMAILNPRVNGD